MTPEGEIKLFVRNPKAPYYGKIIKRYYYVGVADRKECIKQWEYQYVMYWDRCFIQINPKLSQGIMRTYKLQKNIRKRNLNGKTT